MNINHTTNPLISATDRVFIVRFTKRITVICRSNMLMESSLISIVAVYFAAVLLLVRLFTSQNFISDATTLLIEINLRDGTWS